MERGERGWRGGGGRGEGGGEMEREDLPAHTAS